AGFTPRHRSTSACPASSRGIANITASELRADHWFRSLSAWSRRKKMVGVARIELATPAMSTQCSTTELHAHPDQPMWLGEAAFREQLRKAQPGFRPTYSRPC